jgi:hypothetical protein
MTRRAARWSRKPRIAARLSRGPFVEIHVGDVRVGCALDDGAVAPAPPEAPPAAVLATAATVCAGVLDVGAVGAGEGAGVEGVETVGVGTGNVGVGTGRVTVGTVRVVTPGIGTVCPRAWLATRPAPATTPAASTALISPQLLASRFGCGVCVVRNNSGMAVLKRDYYEVLGVARNANGDEIKRAFHALARDWHPDVANAPDAEVRFRELAEAYGVLSRKEARLLYDRYGYRGRGNDGFDEALWEARPREAVRGENVHVQVELKSFEAEDGSRTVVDYVAAVRCEACMGRGSVGVPDPECESCGGTGRKRTVSDLDVANLLQIEPCPACAGEPCSQCGGEGTVLEEHRLKLVIPRGVEDGAQLRVGGDGHDAGAGSIPGDLFVDVKVLPPPRDPRIVRYLAFVLLIVAVATLVIYVIR